MTMEACRRKQVEHLEQLEDHGRRQALERLVQQQQLDVARHRARHRDHLLLAAGEIIRRDIHALLQAREIFEDPLLAPHHAVAAVGLARETPEREIFPHRHAGEQPAALRHIADAHPRDVGRGQAGDAASFVLDGAGRRRHQPGERLQQRRFAGAVAAEQRDDLAFADVERGVMQDVALAIEGVDALEAQDLRGRFLCRVAR